MIASERRRLAGLVPAPVTDAGDFPLDSPGIGDRRRLRLPCGLPHQGLPDDQTFGTARQTDWRTGARMVTHGPEPGRAENTVARGNLLCVQWCRFAYDAVVRAASLAQLARAALL